MERKDQALLRGEEEELARIYSAADWGSGAAKGGPTKNFAAETWKQAQFSLCAGASGPAATSPPRPNLPGPLAGLLKHRARAIYLHLYQNGRPCSCWQPETAHATPACATLTVGLPALPAGKARKAPVTLVTRTISSSPNWTHQRPICSLAIITRISLSLSSKVTCVS